MPRKYTDSDEFEEQFQAFLKQSVSSDESFDLQKKVPLGTKSKKSPKPWWLDDDDDDGKKIGTGLTSGGKSFLKSKKSPEKLKPASSTAKSGKVSKGGVGAKGKAKQGRKKEVSPKRAGRGRTEASMSKDSLEDISEKSEEADHGEAPRFTGLDSSVETTRDSVTADMLTDRQESPEKLGMDTLDEMADKQRFYNEVEADGTIDYGQLNRDLSHTGTSLSPGVAARVSALADSKIKDTPNNSGLSANRGDKNEADASEQKPSMLSKVALLDSLDSTLNTTTSPKASIPGDGSRDMGRDNLGQTLPDTMKTRTGTGMMGTNTSKEMEALQEALLEVASSPTIRQDEVDSGNLMLRGAPDLGVDQRGDRGQSDRTVDDIFREMSEIEKKVKEKEHKEEDVHLRSDYHSPHSHSSNSKGISRQHHVDDDHHYGFDHSHTDDTEVYQPVTTVGDRGRSSLRLYSVREKKNDISSNTLSSTIDGVKASKKPKSKFSHVQSSGYGRRSPSRSPSRSPTRPNTKSATQRREGNQTWSPVHVSRNKVRGTLSIGAAQKELPDKKTPADTRLLQSVESFAHYIQNHFTGKGPMPEVKYSSEEPSVSGSLQVDQEKGSSVERRLRDELADKTLQLTKLQGEMLSLRQQHQEEMDGLKVEHEQELFKLKQENFVLAAKMNEGEGQSEARKKLGEVLSGDAVTREQLNLLEREIKEQESLIAGYQTENQRLYEDMKTLRTNTRTAEQKMFAENQRLVTEVTNLKAQLEQKDMALRNKGIITSLAAQQQIAAGNADSQLTANKVLQLEAELKQCKRESDMHAREVKALQQTKLELDQHIHQLVRTREDLTQQLQEASTLTPQQLRVLEEKHNEEVGRLKQKLKWYAENQELLDKGAAACKKKDEEIKELKLRLEGLATGAGRKLEENKLRAKERAGDAKKIQDLQRQVKEMEQIIRRRHPNSLPALMMVAATAPDNQGSAGKSASVQVLEARIRKLEEELEKKDEESNTLLRAVEQKYHNVKYKFEARVADLEKQLSIYQQSDTPGGHSTTQVQVLEAELNQAQDRNRRQVSQLQAEVDRLTGELTKLNKNQHNLMKNEASGPESELNQQVALLQQELEEKKHDLHVLHTSLQKLRKERVENNNLDNKSKSKSKGKSSKRKLISGETKFASFPLSELNGRDYEPQTFADSDVTELLQENELLRAKVDELQLELSQQRVDLRKSLAESESVARKCREEYEDQISTLRLSHQQELQKMLGDQALHHSSSRLVQLQSKCDTQEVMIEHLKQQLSKAEVDAEQISVLKIREAAKQNQIEKLQDLLQEAKKSHSPEMRHFESLQEKIIQMEKRNQQREVELKQVIANTQRVASLEFDQEVEKWRKIVDIKNSEIQKFRAELDSILDVLRVLQKQGVVLPVSSGYT